MKKPFFNWMREHLRHNSDCVLLLCDLGYPEALDLLALHPDRVINVGVAEQNAAVVAKGLCSQGFEVYIYGVSSFTLWRAAEALKIYFTADDRLRLVGNGGGFGYGVMGSSHHSIEDLGLVSLWNAWNSWMPRRDEELASMLSLVTKSAGPHYLRLTNNDLIKNESFSEIHTFGHGPSVTVVTFGPLMDQVAANLDAKSCTVFGVNKWPTDVSVIHAHFEKSKNIVFLEEHQLEGGLSQKIAATLDGPRKNIQIHSVSHSRLNGSRHYLLESQGLGSQNISKIISSIKE